MSLIKSDLSRELQCHVTLLITQLINFPTNLKTNHKKFADHGDSVKECSIHGAVHVPCCPSVQC